MVVKNMELYNFFCFVGVGGGVGGGLWKTWELYIFGCGGVDGN